MSCVTNPVLAKLVQYTIISSDSNRSCGEKLVGNGRADANGAPKTYGNSSPDILCDSYNSMDIVISNGNSTFAIVMYSHSDSRRLC